MKKILLLLALVMLLNACTDETNNTTEQSQEIAAKEIQMFTIPGAEIINQQFSFSVNDSDSAFQNKNEIINAVNEAIKCTLNPQNQNCNELNIPKFILMEDESLQRPTQMEYKIVKMKPLSGGFLHIYTQSQCNNNWFGLCRGNIIYVMQNKDNAWYVSDIFALADTK